MGIKGTLSKESRKKKRRKRSRSRDMGAERKSNLSMLWNVEKEVESANGRK
jgi:hypothetical protein